MKAALLVLALLLSACVQLAQPVRSGPMIGPSWPHGVCDTVDACWIVP